MLVVGQNAAAVDQLTTPRLFDEALQANGDEYIELRDTLLDRKDAVSFLKSRCRDKDQKTAIIAEAMLDRTRKAKRFSDSEAFLRHIVQRCRSSRFDRSEESMAYLFQKAFRLWILFLYQ